MSKHTPGPWEVVHGAQVFTALGAPKADGVKAHSTDGWHIADCDTGPAFIEDHGQRLLPFSEKEANARLIAAAPDLLNALTVLAGVAESRGIPCDAARAAIAKATGGDA